MLSILVPGGYCDRFLNLSQNRTVYCENLKISWGHSLVCSLPSKKEFLTPALKTNAIAVIKVFWSCTTLFFISLIFPKIFSNFSSTNVKFIINKVKSLISRQRSFLIHIDLSCYFRFNPCLFSYLLILFLNSLNIF